MTRWLLALALLLTACSTAGTPPRAASVETIEVIGDGPVVHPARTATGEDWALVLDCLNNAP